MQRELARTVNAIAGGEVVLTSDSAQPAIEWLELHPQGWDLAIVDMFLKRGHGFDVLLEKRGASSLTTDMDAALQTARTQAQALGAPIDVAVVSNLAGVQQLHADVKVFTDFLKLQFITVLSLQVPAEGAGDAD